MKKITLLFSFLILTIVGLQAQHTTRTQITQNEMSFYFSAGSASLGDDNKAIEIIRSFLGEQKIGDRDTLFIQAYTEDVGNQEESVLLANDRTKSIQQLLLNYPIPSSQVSIKTHQQLEIDGNILVEELQKEFSRVDIIWQSILVEEVKEILVLEEKPIIIPKEKKEPTPINNAELDAFFAEDLAKEIQNFTLDASRGQVVKGKKGTVIQIPANSFVDKKGMVVEGEVQITLQEAYTLKDMVVQNLQTISDGQIIETGGMIKLEAITASGEKLELAADKKIIAAMASEESKLPGMQTFEGEEGSDGNVNWVPTQEAVLTNNSNNAIITPISTNSNNLISRRDVLNQSRWRASTNNRNASTNYPVSTIREAIKLEANLPIFEHKMPRRVKIELKQMPKLPEAPKIHLNLAPTRADLEMKFPQHINESTISYRKRISKKYRHLRDIYFAKRSKNNNNKSRYKRDSINYVRAKKKYDRNVKEYEKYKENVRMVYNETKEKVTTFDLEGYYSSSRELFQAFFGVGYRCNQIASETQNMNEELLAMNVAGYDVNDLLMRAAAASSVDDLKEIPKHIDNLFNMYRRYYSEDYFFKKRSLENKDFEKLMNKFQRFDKKLSTDKEYTNYQLNKIRKYYYEMHEKYRFRALSNAYQTNKATIANRKVYIDKFLSAEENFLALRNEFLNKKKEWGLLDPEEVTKLYGSAMSIKKLGWINCDRFYNDPAPRIDCNILVETQANTNFYLVFENMNAIMKARTNQEGAFVFGNIPNNKKVKLIGIRVNKEGAEMFEKQGKAKDFINFRPVFEKASKEGVTDMIAQH